MSFVAGYLKSGEKVLGDHSYVSKDTLTELLRCIESRGNNTIHIENGIVPYQGKPQVVEIDAETPRVYYRRLKGEDRYPFVEIDKSVRTNQVSIHMEKQNEVYRLKVATYGPFYERDPKHPFWNSHAFVLGASPHRED